MNLHQRTAFYMAGSTDDLDITYESLSLELEDITQEGLTDIFKYLKKVTVLVPRMVDRLLANDVPATNVTPMSVDVYNNIMKHRKLKHDDLVNLMTNRPADLDVPMATHLSVILEQIPRYSNVTERLYEPLIELFASAAADHETLNKLWKSGDLKLNEPDKDAKVFAKHFLVSKYDERPAEMASFVEVYPSAKSCEEVYNMATIAIDHARSIDLKLLKKREAVLITYVNTFLDELDPKDRSANKEIQKTILKAMQAIVSETEYMVGVVNLLTVAVSSWNTSMLNFDDDIAVMLEEQK